MKLSTISEAIINATNVAKVCRGQLAMSACICAAICLSPATAEESYEITENVDALIQQASDSDATSGEVQPVIVTEDLTVAVGESLTIPEKIIIGNDEMPVVNVAIDKEAVLNFGNADKPIVKIKNSTVINDPDLYWTTIANAEISATEDNVKFTRYSNTVSNAKITQANIDLSGISEDATVTIEHITLSDIQFNQTKGSLHIVRAGLSLTAPSHINNLHIDEHSNLFGGKLSTENKLTGQDNFVKLAPLAGAGDASTPATNAKTIGSYQLYSLYIQDNTKVTIDLEHINLDESLVKNGGNFYIEFQGTRWTELNKLTSISNRNPVITDPDFIGDAFVLTNYKGLDVETLKKYLTISSVSYLGNTQGVTLEISVAPFAIPEPTTATLSLLALTALAARRRRA